MALLGRNKDGDGDDVERTERAGTSPGVIRAIATLIGVAVAGFLVWLAQELSGPLAEASEGDFWIAMALLAGAGLALGLSQLLGGWTKWGWPRLSPTVFLLGFLPTLIVGGWILLAKQPQNGIQEGRVDGWSGDIGIAGLVDGLAVFLPVVPLIIGLVLAFSFDTTGPRTRIVTSDGERAVPDEDVHDYRRERDTTTATSDSTVAEELREREAGGATVATGAGVERDDSERRIT